MQCTVANSTSPLRLPNRRMPPGITAALPKYAIPLSVGPPPAKACSGVSQRFSAHCRSLLPATVREPAAASWHANWPPAPDVVVVDFPHAAVLLPKKLDTASVMFTHNVETEIYERHAAVARGPWKLVWKREAAKMQAFERMTLRRFDTVVAVSPRDGRVLRQRFGLKAVEDIDTGVDLEYYAFHPPPDTARTVVFAGAMDSRSNVDGVKFLMNEVWPIVAAARPDAQMAVVGRNPPATLVAEAAKKGLPWRFTGFVDDMRPEGTGGRRFGDPPPRR